MSKKKKNSEQRIKQTLDHKEPDRIPFDFGSGGVTTGITIGAYRRLLSYLGIKKEDIPIMGGIQWQLTKVDENLLERLKVDTRGLCPNPPSNWKLLVQEEGNYKYFTDEWGIKWRMPKQGGHYYDMYQSPLQGEISQKDIDRYPWPNFEDPTAIKGLKEMGEEFRQKGKAIVGERICGGVFEFSALIRGFENFYLDLASNPSLACYLMDKILEIKMAYWEMFLKRLGEYCLVVAESDDLGVQNATTISLEMYRKYIKPRHKKLFSHMKKLAPHCYIFLHSCGSVYDLIPDLIEVGVDILNPVQVSAAKMDTRKLKKEFGKDLTFWGGGVDTQDILPHGTPQQVKYGVKRRIDDLAPGGGFVFAAVHNIQSDVPPENIMAMWEALQEYGVY